MDHETNDFILIPAKGGGALVRRSEIAGGRPNGAEGGIVYLKSGPSVYTTASIPQIAGYLEAEVAHVREG
ncbi:hypothetical protein [Notoacmeibacter sp. MSK16QG-6]|uniref:hypothetical protein n=1 Tax=Notoacmeibacter sp. MSK16QG-6 TaxID=2957982 RepID=UPI00209D609C|nr:hypothetical protein [Notoacmeibacter sp. MSK16QG-6]MCP1199074.1 hypothetical protein [Notoacmeibacter sp. MSK16QG-6]